MRTQVPRPRHWQEFETMCHRLWREIWSDPNAQKHGRRGQPQNGVDVFGTPVYRGHVAGVQCKDRDEQLGSTLTPKELAVECRKATAFQPPIGEFTLATTAARDSNLQQIALKLNADRAFPFSVYVWSWDDIEEEIRYRPNILSLLDVSIESDPDDAVCARLSLVSPTDQAHAFFSRPEIQVRIQSGMRRLLLPLVCELMDNAFVHGHATQFSIKCGASDIVLEDNGVPFDPTTLNLHGDDSFDRGGTRVFSAFREHLKGDVMYDYSRAESKNVLTLRFRQPVAFIAGPIIRQFIIDLGRVAGRDHGQRMAHSIVLPPDDQPITVIVTDVMTVSALIAFVTELSRRTAPARRVNIYLPDDIYVAGLANRIVDQRVSLHVIGH